MRERNLIQSVFEQVSHQLRGRLATRVAVVNVARGEVFELSESSIREAWQSFSNDMPLERPTLKFRSIRAEAQCMACFEKYHPQDGKIHCPHCGSFGAKILAGEEFYLESVETETE